MSRNDYVWLETHEQPELMRSLNEQRNSIKNTVVEELDSKIIDKIVITGCGDCYCSSLAAEQAFSEYTGLQSSGFRPMDVTRYDRVEFNEKTLLIPVSVSGRTPRVIEAVHKARAMQSPVIAVTDNPTSPLSELADATILLKASPPEVLATSSYTEGDAVKYVGYHHDVAQTKTYTQGLLTLYWIALSIGEMNANLQEETVIEKSGYLKELPDMVTSILAREEQINEIARKVYGAPYFIFSGSGPNYGTACYSAFKCYEYSVPALYNDLEEYCHTQYFVTEREHPVVFIAEGESLERASEIVPVIEQTIKAPSLTITSSEDTNFTDNYFNIPYLPEELSPLLTAIPLQLLTYHIAKLRGVNINKFRGGKNTELYVSGSYRTIRSSRVRNDFSNI